jgi:hypothetical protein
MMVKYRSTATPEGRPAEAHGTLLIRIQKELAATRPATITRRCPCCGGPIRTGQRLTTIHGTSVHARCASRNE